MKAFHDIFALCLIASITLSQSATNSGARSTYALTSSSALTIWENDLWPWWPWPTESIPTSESATPSETIPSSESETPSESISASESAAPSETIPASESAAPSETIPSSESETPSESIPLSASAMPSESISPSESATPSESILPPESTAPTESIPPSASATPSPSVPPSVSASIPPFGSAEPPESAPAPLPGNETEDASSGLALPIDLLQNVNDPAAAYDAVSIAASGLSDSQKSDPTVVDHLTLFAEEAVSQASRKTMTDSDMSVGLETAYWLTVNAMSARSAVSRALAENEIQLDRTIRTSVTFSAEQTQDVNIVLQPQTLLLGVDTIRVETPEYGVLFPMDFIEANAGYIDYE
ncbi:MAG: hypothetical protein LBT44_07670, partial [Clostridiales bacterium]|nr:hypothetical protein [Clostridiales bacterium]